MEKAAKEKIETILFTLFITCVLIVALKVSWNWPVRAGIIIWVLGGAGLALTLYQLGTDFKSIFREPAKVEGIVFEAPLPDVGDARWGNLEIWSWLIGLFLVILLVGFPIAVPLFVFAYSKFYGSRWITAIIMSGASWGFVYGVFEKTLHVRWPEPFLYSFFTS
jgi:hypothetical protein